MKKRIFLLPLLLFHLAFFPARAQSPDTASRSPAIDATLSLYARSLGEQARLYTGSQFVEYRYPMMKEHPFFGSPDAAVGTIWYDDMIYRDVPMWYDLVRDEVVVLNAARQIRIVLEGRRVKEFSLAGHRFTRIDTVAALPAGFYELLYDGPSTLLAKRAKRYTEIIDEMTVKLDVYPISPRYYISKDGGFQELKKPSQVKNLFPAKRRELDAFIKTNDLNFRRNPEAAMAAVLAYYDKIAD